MTQPPILQQFLAHYDRFAPRISGGTSAFFVIVASILLAKLVWALMPVPEGARWRPPPVSIDKSQQPKSTEPDLNAIVASHLFGEFTPPKVAAARPDNAPDTRLSLKLIGLIADTEPDLSRALIAASNGDEDTYAIGDQVLSGVELDRIYADRVILSRNGQYETLRLEKDAPSNAIGSVDSPRSNSPDASTTAMLGDIRSKILADPTKASSYLRVQPSTVNGQLRGYRIYPGREREAFKQLGLRPGDLVTAVNGVELNDPQNALQLLGDLSQASTVSVTIERGGQAQNLTVNFN